MIRLGPSVPLLAASALACLLAACSSSSTGLTTSALLPGSKPKPADPPLERALQVAATSARASKCGYNFDPARLRTAYLAYEAKQDGAADKLARLEKAYDFTQASVGSKIGAPDEYCSDERTARIKSDLTRHLAGDYAPPAKKEEGSAVDWWISKSDNKTFDKEKVFCPSGTCY